MQKFESAKLLFQKMKADLNGRMFPSLLTSLAAGAKAFLEAELSAAASKALGQPPRVQMTVETMPAPGRATVKTVFLASAEQSTDVHSETEAIAYKEAFHKVCDEHLNSKSLVLRLLSSVGVS